VTDLHNEVAVPDQRAAPGIGELVLQFLRLQHRAERHDDGAELPDREYCDRILRHVLQEHADAVAQADPALSERDGQRVGCAVELAECQRVVEIMDRSRVGARLQRALEHRKGALCGRFDVVWEPIRILGKPRALPIEIIHWYLLSLELVRSATRRS
jgi:hypothetical protein